MTVSPPRSVFALPVPTSRVPKSRVTVTVAPPSLLSPAPRPQPAAARAAASTATSDAGTRHRTRITTRVSARLPALSVAATLMV